DEKISHSRDKDKTSHEQHDQRWNATHHLNIEGKYLINCEPDEAEKATDQTVSRLGRIGSDDADDEADEYRPDITTKCDAQRQWNAFDKVVENPCVQAWPVKAIAEYTGIGLIEST